MSLILDALNRSQGERANSGDVPGVATVHHAEAPVRPSQWPQAMLGLALVVALGVIAWLIARPDAPQEGGSVIVPDPPAQHSSPAVLQPSQPHLAPSSGQSSGQSFAPELESKEAAPAAPGVPGESVPMPLPRPIASEAAGAVIDESLKAGKANTPDAAGDNRTEVDSTPAATVSAEVAELYANASRSEDAPVASSLAAPEAATSRQEERQKDRQKGQALAPKPASANVSQSESEVDVEAMLAMARAELGNQRVAQTHPAPFVAELSQQRKDAIPTLLYSGHDYRGDGQSSVLINNRTARSGDSVGKGVSVVEILPDSVVLRYDGEEFQLRALNSWVNL